MLTIFAMTFIEAGAFLLLIVFAMILLANWCATQDRCICLMSIVFAITFMTRPIIFTYDGP